ncbi:translation elongation factor-like protein [candidate division TA06 bacterium]|nr:translation elongation factor-like protein [candidate division TA06 bacterium]
MEEIEIGRVSDYFAKIGVAGIEITADELSVGDTIHIKGYTTDLTQVVESIQIEHEKVEKAKTGDSIGIKMTDRVRPNDKIFKVVE